MAESMVSIVIPAFNAAWCVGKAIDSVIGQTYRQIEIIVVNDGSTDNTSEVLSRYQGRIRVITQKNKGLSNARNMGIQHAKGEYIAFLDADDYWLPRKLEYQVQLMNQRPDIGFCSTMARVETLEGIVLSVWRCPKIDTPTLHTIFMQNSAIPGSGSGVMVRSDVLLGMGHFDEKLKSLEDIDMWMRLSAETEYACIPEALTVIVRRDNSMSGNLDVMRRSSFEVMKKNRHLLDKRYRGRFWQACYAGVLADIAKWEYRSGQKEKAILHLLEGLVRSGEQRARLLIGLLFAILKGDPL